MGLGKKIKKAAKKVSKSVSHAVNKVAGKVGGQALSQLTPTLVNMVAPGVGTYITAMKSLSGEVVTPTSVSGDPSLVDTAIGASIARAVSSGVREGSTSAFLHSAEGSLVHQGYESDISSGFKQQQQDEMKRLMNESMQYAAAYAQEMKNKEIAEAKASKNALFGEMESDSAGGRPLNKTYLGSSATGGYIDDEEIKKKKRLGGDKESTKSGSGGTLA